MARLLTVEETARELGIARDRVYFLTHHGLLPCVRLGRAIRIDRTALDEWLKRGGQAWPGGWRREA
ncbi:MAG: helix-turn-helix domain-containing protein [Bacillota bacterium]